MAVLEGRCGVVVVVVHRILCSMACLLLSLSPDSSF